MLGDWDRAFELAMAIDPAVTGAGVYEAAQVAAWTRSVERIERVAARADEVPFTGRLADGTRLFIRATQAALEGDLGAAADHFDELLELFTTIAVDVDVNMVRATYAMLVGEDHPGAVRAGQLAYEWMVETESNGLMKLWADGLPAEAGNQATG